MDIKENIVSVSFWQHDALYNDLQMVVPIKGGKIVGTIMPTDRTSRINKYWGMIELVDENGERSTTGITQSTDLLATQNWATLAIIEMLASLTFRAVYNQN